MIKIKNALEIPDFCYGTGITNRLLRAELNRGNILKYYVSNVKYYTRNFIKDRNRFNRDKQLPNMLNYLKSQQSIFIDTSRAYGGSEYIIGKVFSKYDRNSFVISTKLCNSDQYKGDVRKALKTSLDELNLDYVDVYLMHWPVTGKFIDSWKQMEELYEEGLCKAIGVCNFNIHHFEELKEYAKIMPMINQVECHPLFKQKELREYCKQNNIQIMAYTATGRMDKRLTNTVLVPISKKYNKSVAQIIIKWHKQVGNIPVVNTSNINHLKENFEIDDFELTEEEISQIENINIDVRLRYDPDNCDFTKL